MVAQRVRFFSTSSDTRCSDARLQHASLILCACFQSIGTSLMESRRKHVNACRSPSSVVQGSSCTSGGLAGVHEGHGERVERTKTYVETYSGWSGY